jgi:hypothetical protein
LTADGERPMDADRHEELVSAAVFGATDDEAQAIIERELEAAGLESFIEGSVVYSVQVSPEDLDRAVEVLKSASDLKGHWIQFADE